MAQYVSKSHKSLTIQDLVGSSKISRTLRVKKSKLKNEIQLKFENINTRLNQIVSNLE